MAWPAILESAAWEARVMVARDIKRRGSFMVRVNPNGAVEATQPWGVAKVRKDELPSASSCSSCAPPEVLVVSMRKEVLNSGHESDAGSSSVRDGDSSCE